MLDTKHSRIVVLDTNIYVKVFWLKHSRFTMLEASLVPLNLIWAMPDVVMDELVAKYDEDLLALETQTEQLAKTRRNLTNTDFDIIHVDRTVQRHDYQRFISGFFNERRKIRIPYPEILHKDVVQRASYKTRPFRPNGDGYRDTLIWMSVLDKLQGDDNTEVLFVTNNSADFFDKNGQLHSDLANDLVIRKIDRSRIQCFNSLESLIKEILAPQLEEIENVKTHIKNDKWDILTTDILLDELQKRLQYQEVSLNLPDSNDGQATIDWIDTVEIDYVDIVSKISESKLFVSLFATAYIKFEYFVDKTDLYLYDYNEPRKYEVEEHNWNDHVARVSSHQDTNMEINLIIDTENKSIEQLDYDLSLLSDY